LTSPPLAPSPATSTTDVEEAQSDVGAATAFAKRAKPDLFFVPGNGQWYSRQRNIFRPVPPETVQGLAADFLVGLASSAVAARYPQMQQARNLLSRNKVNATVELSRPRLAVTADRLDRTPHLLGCADGAVLDLKSRKLIDPRDEIVTKRIGASYD